MMDDASHKLWKSEDIAKELEKRLGDAYKPYLMTIRQIEEVTRALAEKLDIQGSNKVRSILSKTLQQRNWIQRQVKRVETAIVYWKVYRKVSWLPRTIPYIASVSALV